MAPSDLLSFVKDVSPILAELFAGAGFGIAVAKLLYGLYEKVYVGNRIEIVERVITRFFVAHWHRNILERTSSTLQ